MHGHRGHRRRGVLKFRERSAIGPGQIFRQRCLEHAQRLAELHRPAFELAQHAEQLLRGAGLELRGDDLGRATADALAQTDGGAAGDAERESRELDAARDRPLRNVAHTSIAADVRGANGVFYNAVQRTLRSSGSLWAITPLSRCR